MAGQNIKSKLKDKSLEELESIAASLKTSREPAEDDPPAVDATPDLKKDLNSLSLEELEKMQQALKTEPEKKDSIINQFLGINRSLLNTRTLGLSEKPIAAVKAFVNRPVHPGITLQETWDNLKKGYDDEIEYGEELKKKYPASEIIETAVRAPLSGFTMGATEPLISKIKAETGLAKSYEADVAERNRMKEKYSSVDLPGEVLGAFYGPWGLTRKGLAVGGEKLLEKYAPGMLAKGTEAVTEYFANNPSAWKSFGREMLKIAGGGVKAAVDAGEQQFIRTKTLQDTGFQSEQNPIEAAATAGKVGVGLSAIPAVGKGLNWAAMKSMPVIFGVPEAEAKRYLENFERLKDRKASLSDVSDTIANTVESIRSDYKSKVLSRDEAQKALDAVEAELKNTQWMNRQRVQNELAEAKKSLDLAFREDEATLRSFNKMMPQGEVERVRESIDELKKQTTAAKRLAMGLLDKSEERISLDGLDNIMKQYKKSLNVGSKGSAFTATAKAAQSEADYYIQQLKSLAKKSPDGMVDVKSLRKMIDQLDNEIEYGNFSQLGNITRSEDIGPIALRRALNDRLLEADIPGYADAIRVSRDSARLLSDARQYFDNPEAIVSTLKSIGEDDKFLGRNVLLEMGKRTNVDFNNTVANAMETAANLKSPSYLAGLKSARPEAEQVARLEAEANQLANPHNAIQERKAMLAQTPEHQQLLQAQGAVDEMQQMYGEYKNWTDLNIDGKMKAIMGGKEAIRRQLQNLGQLTDQDFIQAVDDLRTLGTFDKSFRQGSANVNFWALMGLGADRLNNNRPVGFLAGTMLGKLVDAYGPGVARKILNGIGANKGLITVDKIRAWNLPPYVKEDLTNQFARAIFTGVQDHSPNIQVDPQAAILLRAEIQGNKRLSNTEKAEQLNQLNRYGEVNASKVLLGGMEPPAAEDREQAPIQMEDGTLAAPGLPEIMSRMRSR